MGQIVEQLLPVLFYSAIFTAYCEAVTLQLGDYLAPTFDVLVEKTIKASRDVETKKYQVSLDTSISANFIAFDVDSVAFESFIGKFRLKMTPYIKIT